MQRLLLRDIRFRNLLLVTLVAGLVSPPTVASAAPWIPGVAATAGSQAAALMMQRQGTGTIRGVVRLEGGDIMPGALVLLTILGTSVRTDSAGEFVMENVPAGTYTMVVSRPGVGSLRQDVTVTAGETTSLDLAVQLQGRTEQVTVTASATGETTAFDTFNAVSTLDSMQMSTDMSGTLGEVLENEPGLAKRGLGAGNARPIIRGFDGDRVLILDNGIRTGDLSSQSGDHGTTIDPANVDRVEVVRGPATLLFGSNAIGGVVNAVSAEETFRTTRHDGTHVNATADGGTANNQVGGNVNFNHAGDNWLIYGGGGARKSDDYTSPEGVVENSFADLTNLRLGMGYFGDKAYFSAGYKVERGEFGVPGIGELHGHGHGEEEHEGEHEEEEHDEEEEVDISLDQERQSFRADFGLTNLEQPVVESMRFVFNVIDWNHQEIENIGDEQEVGTNFDNRTYVARAEFDQQRTGSLHGKFGAWYKNRDYEAVGEEALSPPVKQNAFAGFAYEELDFERWRLQFGGRWEWNDYDPEERLVAEPHDHEEELEGEEHDEDHDEEHEEEAPAAIPRSFSGVSGSVGARFDLLTNNALVANFTSSYRAPALEELYNFGPHVGNLTFEIGDPTLEHERSNGVDLSLRHDSNPVQGSLNFFYYDINNFIFVDLHDEEIDGLRVGEFTQGDSRFLGVDGDVSARVHQHLILYGSIGWVDAELDDGTPLPLIPPVRGRIRIEVPYKGLRVEPEIILGAEQNNVPEGTEPYDGYTVWNFGGSYTLVTGRGVHVFSVKGYNLSNELYFNSTSFLRLPEIGRGVKFGWALRLF